MIGPRNYATLIEGIDKSLGDLMDHLEDNRHRREHADHFPRGQRRRCAAGGHGRHFLQRASEGPEGQQVGRRRARSIHRRLGQV